MATWRGQFLASYGVPMDSQNLTLSTATLGGGCFWCLDASFRQLAAVEDVISGYAGGSGGQPDYASVCSGTSGHAEVVQVRFDSSKLNFGELLSIFFAIHDPTTLNRQGNDVGSQYRSVIFTHTAEQQAKALSLIAELDAQEIWPTPIVTAVLSAPTFWPAEDYHQNYFARNPTQGYCQAVVQPKVAKLRQRFSAALRQISR
jgi:peptide-methionine (S)-S-oxide reductase